jgi:putative phosphoesterase
MRILLTADTHVPDHARGLPGQLLEAATSADLVLHAGDVTSPLVLEELAERAPVRCALGNNDGPDVAAWGAAERVEFACDGGRSALVHAAAPGGARPARLRRWFPGADLIVFGHSHIPMAFEDAGVRFVNPGSPTWKRREPTPTMALLDLRRGVVTPTVVALPVPP